LRHGSNFCVFLNYIEIKRGIASFTKIDSNCIAQNDINKISNEYYEKVGLDYRNWQKSDPRYALGLGYYTVDTTMVFGWANLISKEGVFTSNDHLYKSKENEIYGGKIVTYGNSYMLSFTRLLFNSLCYFCKFINLFSKSIGFSLKISGSNSYHL